MSVVDFVARKLRVNLVSTTNTKRGVSILPKTTKDTSATSQTTLLSKTDGKCLQPLEPGVVAASSTLIDNEFWQNDGEKKILALLAMYKSLLDYTCSPDARTLAIMGSVRILSAILPKEEAERLVSEVANKVKRTPQGMDCLFK